uniref:Placenta associated 8 n=1 Tax=Felis catus TaxID=9685 RepID=A0ABI7Y4T7_FELCA
MIKGQSLPSSLIPLLYSKGSWLITEHLACQAMNGLCGTFCFMCLACQVAADMNECCLCGTSVAMRTLYRTRYGISGSICDDYLVTHCCPQCSLCQIKRDINRRRAMHTF